jgi:hypothetical protein
VTGYQESFLQDFDLPEDALAGASITYGSEILYSGPIRRLFDQRLYPRARSIAKQETPSIFVPASKLEARTVGEPWDNVTLRDEEDDVIRGLNLIAPEVARVTLIGETERTRESRRVPVARTRSLSEPVPLGTLGEGIVRLFNITLALANAKDGLLLIDEVDSGLHYSVHRDLWRLIFEVATRLNTQVFATTHSWDCIEGFQNAAQEENYTSGMLIRLERRQGHIVPVLFDYDRLTRATRQDIEVR